MPVFYWCFKLALVTSDKEIVGLHTEFGISWFNG